ncbi:hypothetical protein IWX81_002581 [Salinibacterium sp. CAN_S4]
MDAIVSAAGYEWRETGSGADALGLDGDVHFPEGPVGVQVKTTHKHQIGGTNSRLSYTAKQHWVDSWAIARRPIYFVVVVVPHDITGGPWLNHHSGGTDMLDTAAYWTRIDPTSFSPQNMSVAALRSQRVEAATLRQWQREMIQDFGG